MKANFEDMIAVRLSEIDPQVALPFPIYIHLPVNKKFIALRHAGDALGKEKYRSLNSFSHFCLYTLKAYKEFLQPTEVNPGAVDRVESGIGASFSPEKSSNRPRVASTDSAESIKSASKRPNATDRLLEYPSLVEDVLFDKVLDRSDKAEILSEVAEDTLRVINQITNRGEEAKAEGFKRSKDIVDKILLVASQDSDVYAEVLEIWSSQDAVLHTVGVGTLAVMFAMCLGYSDERILADIVVAAIFHDIGKTKISEIASKATAARTVDEEKKFETHALRGVEMLKQSERNFHPRVFAMIEQHHERYDGRGYPKGIKGPELTESTQLLLLANYFDDLCSGNKSGNSLSPADAFDQIYDPDSSAKGIVSPELLERLFQFMGSSRNM